MRNILLFLHRWLGLTIGLVVAWLGLTGSALIFRPEIDARMFPELLQVVPREEKASWQLMKNAVDSTYPERQVSFANMATSAHASHEFWLDGGKLRVYVDPYSGNILGARGQNDDLNSWLANAHINLLSGETGHTFTGITGLVLMALSLSGLILWFPRAWKRRSAWKRAFAPHWRTNWRGRIYELHRAGGFWLCSLLFVQALTGSTLVWSEGVNTALDRIGFAASAAPPTSANLEKTALSLDNLIARVEAAFPDGRMMRVSFPSKPGGPLTIRKKLPDELHPNGRNSITIDSTNGQILNISDTRRSSLRDRLLDLRYPLHIGHWGGNVTRVLAVIVGLTLPLFWISGLIMWWNLKRQRSQATARKKQRAEQARSTL